MKQIEMDHESGIKRGMAASEPMINLHRNISSLTIVVEVLASLLVCIIVMVVAQANQAASNGLVSLSVSGISHQLLRQQQQQQQQQQHYYYHQPPYNQHHKTDDRKYQISSNNNSKGLKGDQHHYQYKYENKNNKDNKTSNNNIIIINGSIINKLPGSNVSQPTKPTSPSDQYEATTTPTTDNTTNYHFGHNNGKQSSSSSHQVGHVSFTTTSTDDSSSTSTSTSTSSKGLNDNPWSLLKNNNYSISSPSHVSQVASKPLLKENNQQSQHRHCHQQHHQNQNNQNNQVKLDLPISDTNTIMQLNSITPPADILKILGPSSAKNLIPITLASNDWRNKPIGDQPNYYFKHQHQRQQHQHYGHIEEVHGDWQHPSYHKEHQVNYEAWPSSIHDEPSKLSTSLPSYSNSLIIMPSQLAKEDQALVRHHQHHRHQLDRLRTIKEHQQSEHKWMPQITSSSSRNILGETKERQEDEEQQFVTLGFVVETNDINNNANANANNNETTIYMDDIMAQVEDQPLVIRASKVNGGASSSNEQVANNDGQIGSPGNDLTDWIVSALDSSDGTSETSDEDRNANEQIDNDDFNEESNETNDQRVELNDGTNTNTESIKAKVKGRSRRRRSGRHRAAVEEKEPSGLLTNEEEFVSAGSASHQIGEGAAQHGQQQQRYDINKSTNNESSRRESIGEQDDAGNRSDPNPEEKSQSNIERLMALYEKHLMEMEPNTNKELIEGEQEHRHPIIRMTDIDWNGRTSVAADSNTESDFSSSSGFDSNYGFEGSRESPSNAAQWSNPDESPYGETDPVNSRQSSANLNLNVDLTSQQKNQNQNDHENNQNIQQVANNQQQQQQQQSQDLLDSCFQPNETDVMKETIKRIISPFVNVTSINPELFLNETFLVDYGLHLGNGTGNQSALQCLYMIRDTNYRTLEFITTVIVPIVFTFIFIIGLLGNIIVAWVIIGERQRGSLSTTNILVLDLCAADILFIITCIPFTAWDYCVHNWIFGQVWCQLNQYLIVVCALSSIYTLVLMSIDRFMAAVIPFGSMVYRTPWNTTMAIFLKWLLILALSYPVIERHGLDTMPGGGPQQCRFVKSAEYDPVVFQLIFFITSYLVPLIIIIVLYCKILFKIWCGTKPKGHTSSSKQLESRKKATSLVFSIIGVFMICWGPIQVMLVLMRYQAYDETVFFVGLQVFAHTLGYSNSCINPIVYALASDKFINDFKRSFWGQIVGCMGQDSSQQSHITQQTIIIPINSQQQHQFQQHDNNNNNNNYHHHHFVTGSHNLNKLKATNSTSSNSSQQLSGKGKFMANDCYVVTTKQTKTTTKAITTTTNTPVPTPTTTTPTPTPSPLQATTTTTTTKNLQSPTQATSFNNDKLADQKETEISEKRLLHRQTEEDNNEKIPTINTDDIQSNITREISTSSVNCPRRPAKCLPIARNDNELDQSQSNPNKLAINAHIEIKSISDHTTNDGGVNKTTTDSPQATTTINHHQAQYQDNKTINNQMHHHQSSIDNGGALPITQTNQTETGPRQSVSVHQQLNGSCCPANPSGRITNLYHPSNDPENFENLDDSTTRKRKRQRGAGNNGAHPTTVNETAINIVTNNSPSAIRNNFE